MKKSFIRSAICMLITVWFFSCDKEPANPAPIDEIPSNTFSTGWNPEKENISEVPMAPYFGFGNANLPTRYDLSEYFPPIGNQGNYGTCVAWSIGYNTKTAVSAIARGLDRQQLQQPQNQYSPKDLFMSVPDDSKGAGCDGTNFTVALEQLQKRGIARMSTVPYDNLGGCQQSLIKSEWTQDAAKNKIEYWRRIDASVKSIKENISKRIPVILGAKLADNFISWNSDAVLTSNTTYQNVGQHSYHAMAIVGYDDAKGSGGAFRVINSWSPTWGDEGFIWVDYNFLINDFCVPFNGAKPLFIVANQEGEKKDDTPPEDFKPVSKGVDLASWIFGDQSTYQSSGDLTQRQVYMNIYNIGQKTAKASDNWSVYYIYYNAYDINDYGVIFNDEFTSSIAKNTYQCATYDQCLFNLDIPAGEDFASEAFDDIGIYRTYNMPNLNGYYYLILYADGDDVYQEEDELNNIFYTSEIPILFENGYAALKRKGAVSSPGTEFEFDNPEKPTARNLRKNRFNTAVSEKTPNSYTSAEVRNFIRNEKTTGRLDQKMEQIPVENDRGIYGPVSK